MCHTLIWQSFGLLMIALVYKIDNGCFGSGTAETVHAGDWQGED